MLEPAADSCDALIQWLNRDLFAPFDSLLAYAALERALPPYEPGTLPTVIPGLRDQICVRFYTDTNEYTVVGYFALRDDKLKSYLGCKVRPRKAPAGSNRCLVDDLPDGRFTETTWRTILSAIVRHELVPVGA